MQPDNSFIRLMPTLSGALQLGDPRVSKLNYHCIISLSPDDVYLQITNTQYGFYPPGDMEVHVLDCNGQVLSEITDYTGIQLFTHNGGQQARIEYTFPSLDYYYKPVIIRISSGSWKRYSNPVLITNENPEEVTRFDYWASRDFRNIPYGDSGFKQSVGLRCYYNQDEPEDTVKDYVQMNDRLISAGVRLGNQKQFRFDKMNPFVRERVRTMLSHDIIYIDGERCTNKPNLKNGERKGDSNLSDASFIASIDENDRFYPTHQILDGLEVVERFPEAGVYTIEQYNGDALYLAYLIFNRNITVNEGLVFRLLKNGVQILEMSYHDIPSDRLRFADSTVSIDIVADGGGEDGVIDSDGIYDHIIMAGMVKGDNGEYFGGYAVGQWQIKIIQGYSAAHYNSDKYLTS